MDFEKFMAATYAAIETIRSGDLDQASVSIESEDDEGHQAMQIILSRDVVSRHEVERVDEALEDLKRGE